MTVLCHLTSRTCCIMSSSTWCDCVLFMRICVLQASCTYPWMYSHCRLSFCWCNRPGTTRQSTMAIHPRVRAGRLHDAYAHENAWDPVTVTRVQPRKCRYTSSPCDSNPRSMSTATTGYEMDPSYSNITCQLPQRHHPATMQVLRPTLQRPVVPHQGPCRWRDG
jgi:hypothetical protein